MLRPFCLNERYFSKTVRFFAYGDTFGRRFAYDPTMSETHPSDSVPTTASRPVLLWLAEGDQTQIKPNVQQAGEFLGVSPEAITAAIVSGEPLHGWFVDWQAQ